MFDVRAIGLAEAAAAIEAMKEEAAKGGRPMSMAVVDMMGNLVAFERMDGAGPLTARMAQNKAYTSASFGMDTRMYFNWLKGDEKDIAWYDDHRLTAVIGGIVVRSKEGQPVGAIGTSGRKQEEDEELALVGKQAAEALL